MLVMLWMQNVKITNELTFKTTNDNIWKYGCVTFLCLMKKAASVVNISFTELCPWNVIMACEVVSDVHLPSGTFYLEYGRLLLPRAEITLDLFFLRFFHLKHTALVN